jgi:hypothetical protein
VWDWSSGSFPGTCSYQLDHHTCARRHTHKKQFQPKGINRLKSLFWNFLFWNLPPANVDCLQWTVLFNTYFIQLELWIFTDCTCLNVTLLRAARRKSQREREREQTRTLRYMNKPTNLRKFLSAGLLPIETLSFRPDVFSRNLSWLLCINSERSILLSSFGKFIEVNAHKIQNSWFSKSICVMNMPLKGKTVPVTGREGP